MNEQYADQMTAQENQYNTTQLNAEPNSQVVSQVRGVTAYRHLLHYLHQHLYRCECPSSFDLGLYAHGWLQGPERIKEIDLHVRQCLCCQHEMLIFQSTIAEV